MTDLVSEIEFDGSRLRQARGERTATEIAEAVGITKQSYSQMELGQIKPSADVLLRLCKVLNLQVEQLAR